MALSPKVLRQLQSLLGKTSATSLATEIQSGDTTFSADTISEFTAGSGVTVDGVLLKDGKVDLNGVAGALILDADADTHIGASTDDQIDITISGAADFRLTANTFTALSGSAIATNTISETTADAGVTVDSVLLKDGNVDLNGAGSILLDADGNSLLVSLEDDVVSLGIGGNSHTDFTATALVVAVVGNFSAAGIRTEQAVTQVNDNTPSNAELETAFGAASGLGRGWIGTVDDNDGDANGFIVWTSDASFYFVKGTKAA
jgi:hypothetical protein